MRRLSLALALVLAATGIATADEAEPKLLGIGDKVPALDIAHYFKGDAVKAYDKEMVYVLEFWATW